MQERWLDDLIDQMRVYQRVNLLWLLDLQHTTITLCAELQLWFYLPPTLDILEESWMRMDLLCFDFFSCWLLSQTEKYLAALKKATMNGCFD